jgi:hypothetical protein
MDGNSLGMAPETAFAGNNALGSTGARNDDEAGSKTGDVGAALLAGSYDPSSNNAILSWDSFN